MNKKTKAHSQQTENSELESFHKYSLQLPTMHTLRMPRLQNTLFTVRREKNLLRGGLIVYSGWNALVVCKSSRDTLTKPVRLP